MMKFFIYLALVLPASAMARNCYAPWGGLIRDGASVLAYQTNIATNGSTCRYEYRTCRNGFLSGSYRYQSCRADNGCNTEFGYMRHLQSITAYLSPEAYAPNKCQSEVRRCQYGRLSGSYHYRSCTERS